MSHEQQTGVSFERQVRGAVGRDLSPVMHELRNVVGALLMTVGNLRRGLSNPALSQEAIQTLEEIGGKMRCLVEEIGVVIASDLSASAQAKRLRLPHRVS